MSWPALATGGMFSTRLFRRVSVRMVPACTKVLYRQIRKSTGARIELVFERISISGKPNGIPVINVENKRRSVILTDEKNQAGWPV
jgi:hypothetical protein